MSYDVMATFKLRDQMSDKMRNIGRESIRTERQIASLSRTTSGLGASFGKTAASIVTGGAAIVGAIGGIAAAYGAVKIVSSALKLANDAEQANIAFTTMLGSADKAASFLAELSNFANATPFELPGLRDSAKKMLAFGFAADSVIPNLTAVGNAAAGLGLGADGVDRITLALGQMRAKSKVSGDEMLQLVEAGIPAWEILSDKMKISTAQVMKMSEKGLIPADKAIQALIDGMNRKFPDMMAKQSKSLAGLWSTMKDTFNNKILVKFGEGIASALKPRFDAVATWINANGDTIKRWGDTIQRVTAAAADSIARKFESAFSYVKTHFLDNPAFTSIPDIPGKVTFIIDDLLATYKKWYNDEGSAMIKSATDNIVGNIATSLSDNAGKLIEPALKLGATIANGMASGLQTALADHPLLSMALGGLAGSRFGIWGAAAGAIGGAAASFNAQRQETANNPQSSVMTDLFGSQSFDGGRGLTPFDNPSSFAGGLDRVGYNGMPAILHKDERVQTKAEADAYRSNRGSAGSGITINMNGTVIREEADIDKLARALAVEIRAVREAGVYAG